MSWSAPGKDLLRWTFLSSLFSWWSIQCIANTLLCYSEL